MKSKHSKGHILVVDDHAEMGDLLAEQLGDEGYTVETATSGKAALASVNKESPDIVVTDLRMEDVDGLDVLDSVHRVAPSTPVIIMTAFGAVDSAIEAIKRGAFHYITKPFQLAEILVYIERALDDRAVRSENRALRRMALDHSSLDKLIGASEPMVELRALIKKVAATDVSVLVRGESGTGKELVARAIHFSGARAHEAFVPVNCAVLPEALLESELFGHVAGAFTGAGAARQGLFVEADGGSLLLDEIGDMPTKLQSKLLRVLEGGVVRPVGSDRARAVDVRIIAATHQDLDEHIASGEFREDLFFRLNVIPIEIPPLRERRGDVALLVHHFIDRTRTAHPSASVETFSQELMAELEQYPWPGNVRELKNVVERLVILGDTSRCDVSDLEDYAALRPVESFELERPADELQPLRQITDQYIDWAIKQCGGNKTRAAEVLEIDVSTIYRREKTRPD